MNKILKILSILVIGFVMFSCSTPTNDPTPYVPEPSGPEPQGYSITFVAEDPRYDQPLVDFLNSLPEFKNLEEGTEVELLTTVYIISEDNYTLDPTSIRAILKYEKNITSVVIGNENIEIKVEVVCFTDI